MRHSILIERNISVNYKTNHKGNTFFRNRLYVDSTSKVIKRGKKEI